MIKLGKIHLRSLTIEPRIGRGSTSANLFQAGRDIGNSPPELKVVYRIICLNNPVNLTDPSGLIMPKGFWTGGGPGGLGMLTGRAIGATIGGAIGAYVGTNIGMELGFTFGGALGLPAGPLGSFAGGLAGGAIVGAAGGLAGGWIGGLFDSPCAGQLNCGEETPSMPSQEKPCP